MTDRIKTPLLFAGVALLILLTGVLQSWNSALVILNMGLISAIMALGVNLQWGFAGLFNTGIMGFVALGGLATVLVTAAPVPGVTTGQALAVLGALALGAGVIVAAILMWQHLRRARGLAVTVTLIAGFFLFRAVFDPAVALIEANNPASAGNIGGLGLPALWAWPVGGMLAAGAAWVIGKTALGLRSDYLAIATLGIAEIVIAVLKNEDWLARGVKNMIGLPRPWPVPLEVDLQQDPGFIAQAAGLGLDTTTASTLWVQLIYAVLFAIVLAILFWLVERARHSPWGRLMRAIRDNEVAASAMGKNVTARHLQVFVLGSAIVGIAGAMMTSLDGQLTPGSYQPLRFTFLVWVMVIVGGSGNNWGAVLGGFLIWFLWVQVEPLGNLLMQAITTGMTDSPLKTHLIDSAAHMRLFTMGLLLLLVLRFSPRGLIPEK